MEKNSVIRKKAVAIVAMRALGYGTDEIAKELRIKPTAVRQYVYRASKSGWLVDPKGQTMFTDPNDVAQFDLAHKAVRNMNEFLDSRDLETRKEFTKEVAHGTIFKLPDSGADSMTSGLHQVLAIKIEMPTTGSAVVREGSVGGSPIYEEGNFD